MDWSVQFAQGPPALCQAQSGEGQMLPTALAASALPEGASSPLRESSVPPNSTEAESPSLGMMTDHLKNQVLLCLYFLVFLIGLPANLLALRAFGGRVLQPQPAPIHVLLLSLTLADLLLLLLLPFKMLEAAHDFHWFLPKVLCALTAYGFYSGIYCSTWLLAGISIERYRSVAYPMQYKLSRRPVYGIIAALVAWIMSFGHCSIVIIVLYLPGENTMRANLSTCYDDFTQEQLDVLVPVRLELCLVLFFIPMVVTIFCYWRFVTIMLSRPQVGAQKRWRAVALAVFTLLNFLVCFGPYNVSHIVGFFQQDSQRWRTCVVLLGALNACIDPLIFYFSSSAMRKVFHAKWQMLRSWGATLMGCWRRRVRERGKERTGVVNVSFTTGAGGDVSERGERGA